jgi:hypothetical protein
LMLLALTFGMGISFWEESELGPSLAYKTKGHE